MQILKKVSIDVLTKVIAGGILIGIPIYFPVVRTALWTFIYYELSAPLSVLLLGALVIAITVYYLAKRKFTFQQPLISPAPSDIKRSKVYQTLNSYVEEKFGNVLWKWSWRETYDNKIDIESLRPYCLHHSPKQLMSKAYDRYSCLKCSNEIFHNPPFVRQMGVSMNKNYIEVEVHIRSKAEALLESLN